MGGHKNMHTIAAAAKLTYQDFLTFPSEDGKRHELIDGVHYVTAVPVVKHQRACSRLGGYFFDYFEAHPIGEAFGVPLDVLLSDHDIVEPDLQVVLADQAHILSEKHVIGAPAIVVEALSPSTRRRDEGIKRQLYDRSGVREYWILDAERETIVVWSRSAEGRLVRAATLRKSDGDVLTSPLLPEFSLPLTDLFR